MEKIQIIDDYLKINKKPLGFVQWYGNKVPVTWEEESPKFVKHVKRIDMVNGKIIISKRLYEDKMPKDEIYYKP